MVLIEKFEKRKMIILLALALILCLALVSRYKGYIEDQIHIKGWSFATTNLTLLNALETYDLEDEASKERIHQLYFQLESDYMELTNAYNTLNFWDCKDPIGFTEVMEAQSISFDAEEYSWRELMNVQQSVFGILKDSDIDAMSLSYWNQENKSTKRLIVGSWDQVLNRLGELDSQLEMSKNKENSNQAELPTIKFVGKGSRVRDER